MVKDTGEGAPVSFILRCGREEVPPFCKGGWGVRLVMKDVGEGAPMSFISRCGGEHPPLFIKGDGGLQRYVSSF